MHCPGPRGPSSGDLEELAGIPHVEVPGQLLQQPDGVEGLRANNSNLLPNTPCGLSTLTTKKEKRKLHMSSVPDALPLSDVQFQKLRR